MGTINSGRIVLGGLVAGLIINLSEWMVNGLILKQDWMDAMKALNKAGGEPTGAQIAGFNLWGFATGIILIFLYAAIRPRFGEGPKTAAIAGVVVWILGYVLAGVAPVIMDIFPVRMMIIGAGIGLIEVIVAGIAGAALYKEESALMARSATS